MPFEPRPRQRELLAYVESGGRMGVAAVPGSGKTQILSYLAAELIHAGLLDDERVVDEALVVEHVDRAANRELI